jgi:hypothetical protein
VLVASAFLFCLMGLGAVFGKTPGDFLRGVNGWSLLWAVGPQPVTSAIFHESVMEGGNAQFDQVGQLRSELIERFTAHLLA